MNWIVKLQRHGGQYRISLPKELVEGAGLKDVEVVYLYVWDGRVICAEEYYGKGKEKTNIQKDKS